MDIPLKSKPKVSTVNLLADSKFEIGSTTNSSAPLDIDNNDKDEPSQLNPNYLKIRHSSKESTTRAATTRRISSKLYIFSTILGNREEQF